MFRSPFVRNGQNRQLYVETGSKISGCQGLEDEEGGEEGGETAGGWGFF